MESERTGSGAEKGQEVNRKLCNGPEVAGRAEVEADRKPEVNRKLRKGPEMGVGHHVEMDRTRRRTGSASERRQEVKRKRGYGEEAARGEMKHTPEVGGPKVGAAQEVGGSRVGVGRREGRAGRGTDSKWAWHVPTPPTHPSRPSPAHLAVATPPRCIDSLPRPHDPVTP